MRLTIGNTWLIIFINAIHVLSSLFIRLINISKIEIDNSIYRYLPFLSEICYLLTAIYLVIAFKAYSNKRKVTGFILFVIVEIGSFILFSFFPFPQELLLITAGLSILLFALSVYNGILSFKVMPPKLRTPYSLFFFSFVLIQVITTSAPLIVVFVLNTQPTSNFSYLGLVSILPYLAIFFILKRILDLIKSLDTMTLNAII